MASLTAQADVDLFLWINTGDRLACLMIRHSGQHQALEKRLAADEKILGIEHRLVHKTAALRDLFVEHGTQVYERPRKESDDQATGK